MSISRLIHEAVSSTSAGGGASLEAQHTKFYGVYIGTVTDNKDPQDRYRVKVKLMSLHQEHATFWAKVGTMMAGKDIGFHCLPEVGDMVLVAFEAGDAHQEDGVYVICSLWNEKDKGLQEAKAMPTKHTAFNLPNNKQSGKNDIRMWRSRGKHQITIGDKDGEGFISIRTASKAELHLDDKTGDVRLYDKNNTQWLHIDVEGKKITLQSDTGEIYIKAKTKITMECEDWILKASKTVKGESGTSTDWKAGSTWVQKSGSTMDMLADGNMKAKAPKIDLNP